MKKIFATIFLGFLVLSFLSVFWPQDVSAGNDLEVSAKAFDKSNVKLTWAEEKGKTYTIKRDGIVLDTVKATQTQGVYDDKNVPNGEHSYDINGSSIAITKADNTLTIKTAAATSSDVPVPDANDINLPDSNFTGLRGIYDALVTWLLITGGALSVVALVYSGFMYITAGGDAEKAGKAKKNLTWAIIGLVVTILAVVIVQYINQVINTSP